MPPIPFRNPVDLSMTEHTVTIVASYHPDFGPAAKRIGGKFSSGGWTFDRRDLARVKALCRDVYGSDGSAYTPTTVQVSLTGTGWDYPDDALWFAGRRVAYRSGRDVPVRLGDDVILIAGGFPDSGGSRVNVRLEPEPGTVLEVRDLPPHRHLEDPPPYMSVVPAPVDLGEAPDEVRNAADLPAGSVVASATVAYIKDHPTATAQWRGTNGGYFGDWKIDEELVASAEILRVGGGADR